MNILFVVFVCATSVLCHPVSDPEIPSKGVQIREDASGNDIFLTRNDGTVIDDETAKTTLPITSEASTISFVNNLDDKGIKIIRDIITKIANGMKVNDTDNARKSENNPEKLLKTVVPEMVTEKQKKDGSPEVSSLDYTADDYMISNQNPSKGVDTKVEDPEKSVFSIVPFDIEKSESLLNKPENENVQDRFEEPLTITPTKEEKVVEIPLDVQNPNQEDQYLPDLDYPDTILNDFSLNNPILSPYDTLPLNTYPSESTSMNDGKPAHEIVNPFLRQEVSEPVTQDAEFQNSEDNFIHSDFEKDIPADYEDATYENYNPNDKMPMSDNYDYDNERNLPVPSNNQMAMNNNYDYDVKGRNFPSPSNNQMPMNNNYDYDVKGRNFPSPSNIQMPMNNNYDYDVKERNFPSPSNNQMPMNNNYDYDFNGRNFPALSYNQMPMMMNSHYMINDPFGQSMNTRSNYPSHSMSYPRNEFSTIIYRNPMASPMSANPNNPLQNVSDDKFSLLIEQLFPGILKKSNPQNSKKDITLYIDTYPEITMKENKPFLINEMKLNEITTNYQNKPQEIVMEIGNMKPMAENDYNSLQINQDDYGKHDFGIKPVREEFNNEIFSEQEDFNAESEMNEEMANQSFDMPDINPYYGYRTYAPQYYHALYMRPEEYSFHYPNRQYMPTPFYSGLPGPMNDNYNMGPQGYFPNRNPIPNIPEPMLGAQMDMPYNYPSNPNDYNTKNYDWRFYTPNQYQMNYNRFAPSSYDRYPVPPY